jgi:hypothetical protein
LWRFRRLLARAFVVAKKIDRQKRRLVSPAVAPQNIEITHDLYRHRRLQGGSGATDYQP